MANEDPQASPWGWQYDAINLPQPTPSSSNSSESNVNLAIVGYGAVDEFCPVLQGGVVLRYQVDSRGKPARLTPGLPEQPDTEHLTRMAQVVCGRSAYGLATGTRVSSYELQADIDPGNSGCYTFRPASLIGVLDYFRSEKAIDVVLLSTTWYQDTQHFEKYENVVAELIGELAEKGKLVVMPVGDKSVNHPDRTKSLPGVLGGHPPSARRGIAVGGVTPKHVPHPQCLIGTHVREGRSYHFPDLWAPGEFDVWTQSSGPRGQAGSRRTTRGSRLAAACVSAIACRLLATSRTFLHEPPVSPHEFRSILLDTSRRVVIGSPAGMISHGEALRGLLKFLTRRAGR